VPRIGGTPMPIWKRIVFHPLGWMLELFLSCLLTLLLWYLIYHVLVSIFRSFK